MTIDPAIISGNWYKLANGRYFQVDAYHYDENRAVIIYSDGTEESVELDLWNDLEPIPLDPEDGIEELLESYFEFEID